MSHHWIQNLAHAIVKDMGFLCPYQFTNHIQYTKNTVQIVMHVTDYFVNL